MDCLDENTVVAFFESRLTESERAEVDEHLAGCRGCRKLLAEYAAVAPRRPETTPTGHADTAPSPEAQSEDGLVDLGRRIAHAQAARRLGTVLRGRWTLERLLGVGGMAQVYQATHRNGRAVAVKVMRPELAVEPLFVERFLREGYVANKVDHPGAVAVLDDDVTPDGAPFLVMELLRGRSLSDRVRAAGVLPVDDALGVAVAVLGVLAAAHDKGIVHRDIKPDNLFETDSGEIKVLDFGIARLREGLGAQGQTQSGVTMGTVGYMPPEQARGQTNAVDARSDLWAVGATLYTLVTGKCLHEAATANEALLLAMTEKVPPMRTLVPELPPPVAELLDRALAFDKAERFPDAGAMQKAAEQARGTNAVLAAPTPKVGQSGTLLGFPQPGSLLAVTTPTTEDRADRDAAPPEAAAPARVPPPFVQKRTGAWVATAAALLVLGTWAGVRTISPRGSTASTPPLPSALPEPVAPPTAAPPLTVPEPTPPSPSPSPASPPPAVTTIDASPPVTASSPPPERPTPRPQPAKTAPRPSNRPPTVAPRPSQDPLGPRR